MLSGAECVMWEVCHEWMQDRDQFPWLEPDEDWQAALFFINHIQNQITRKELTNF